MKWISPLPLEFYIETTATVHLESVLHASELGVQEQEGGGAGARRSARNAARSKPNVELPHESSVRIMDAWKQKHPKDARLVI